MTAIVLAGGRATRMGGVDKGLVELAGRPMVAHIVERLAPQVAEIVINANRSQEAYSALTSRVVADTLEGFLGPLAGLLAGMSVARHERVASVPCDSPFVPSDFVARLATALTDAGADLAVAHDGVRRQPVFLLTYTALAGDLQSWLEAGGRKIDAWFERHTVVDVDFSGCPEAMLNINTPEDRLAIEARLSREGPA